MPWELLIPIGKMLWQVLVFIGTMSWQVLILISEIPWEVLILISKFPWKVLITILCTVLTFLAPQVFKYLKGLIGNQINSLIGLLTDHLIDYVRNYDTNIKNLEDEVEKLKSAEENVWIKVDEANSNGEEIYQNVLTWLERVDGVVGQAEQIAKDKEDREKTRCLKGCCPNLKTRYQLSKRARELAQVAVRIRGEGNFVRVSHYKPPQVIRHVRGFEAFNSRASVLHYILKALKDVDVNLMGVYGLSGVGKTTLAKEVAFRVKEETMFKSVVMVTVTHQLDVKKVQQEIAEKLDFKIDGEFIDVRAARLSKRIHGEDKILVILDDIWEAIKLEEIGIPYGSDHKGCKILMTSRTQNVFLEMGVQKDFQLEVLNAQEAWDLFQNTVGGFKDSNIESLASDVAKRCAGLPVLIVTVATSLKNKGESEWIDASEELKRCENEGLSERIYKALELSYNFLGDEQKSLFLLCGQLRPHFILMRDLLNYSIGLGLFRRRSTLKATRQRLLKVVNDLKRSCLLLEGIDEDHIKMHDVVHGFALSAAIKDRRIFIVPYGTELEEWPKKDMYEQSTAVSFPDCKKIPKFPEVFECPNLSSFLFYNNDSSVRIPMRFFNRMKELKLLDLTGVHLSPVPSSLQDLENLQTLCLDFCDLEDTAVIGDLKKLQVLSFVGSTIIQLPKQVGNLTRLQRLDLSECKKLAVIPAGVLTRLTRLEELCMGDSFVQWEEEGHTSTGNNANLGELKLLSNLAILEMQVIDSKVWPDGMPFGKLDRFKIFIGENWGWYGKYKTSKTLKLQINTSIQLSKFIGLLKRAEDVYLDDMKGVKSILYALDDQGFPEMKHLNVQNSPDIQHIMDCTGMHSSYAAFPKLESLTLDYLVSLEKICDGAIKEGSFSRLRRLNVRNCDRLKNVFSFSMATSLVKLEEIHVSSCKTMEEIVVKENGDNSGNDEEIELTQLCSLTLENLPQLMSFNSSPEIPPVTTRTSSLEIVSADEPETPKPLFSRKIMLSHLEELKLISLGMEKIWSKQLMEQSQCLQKLTTFVLEDCENLNYLFTSSMIQTLTQLKKLEIYNCKSMEEIILMSQRGLEKETVDNILFPKLEYLKLKNLPKLRSFYTTNLIECPSLKVVWIERCQELKTFTSSNEHIDLTLFNKKVAFPKLEELHIKYMNKLKRIWHDGSQANSLKLLELENAKEILKICESGYFQNLESLFVHNCDLLEEVFDDRFQLAPFQLRTLDLRDLPSLKHVWKWNEDQGQIVPFDKLRSITVINCESLKSLFPFFIARNLPHLEVLCMQDCDMEYIVDEEKNTQTTPRFTFPRLKTFDLQILQNLKSFYPGIYILECPELQNLATYYCEKLNMFYSNEEDRHERNAGSIEAAQVKQPLFSFKEVVPNLVELGLNGKDVTMMPQDPFPAVPLHKLKTLRLQCFYDTMTNFPFHLLHKFPNVERLGLMRCYFKEIVSSSTAAEHANALARIRFLFLQFLPETRHIWNPNCQTGQALQNLQTLEVCDCDALVNLAPSSASFANLTTLDVWRCEGLINLVTTSVAKGMVNLTTMTVSECKSMTEIVGNERDEYQSWCEVIFLKLTSVKLVSLSSLTCFSPSASCVFKFPSLEEVIVTQCPKMKVFSRGVISTPLLQKVHINEEMDKCRWMIKDLNTTIQQLYAEMIGFNGVQHLELSEYPELKMVWHHNSLPVNFFTRLNKLVVNEYEISSHAVPSSLLPSLSELEELEVRNCDSVEEVFGPERPNGNGLSGHLPMLNMLHLIDLPRLRQFWPNVPEGFLDLKSIKLLKIHNCDSLRNVLTADMCMGLVQLREIEVKRCAMLEEIIIDGIAVEGDMNEIIFPHLNSITLECLPSLSNFISGTGIVNCPELKEITIADCPSRFASTLLRTLATDEFLEPKITFPKLADIKLYSIGVEKIWKNQPYQSIQQLTTLIVDGCGNINYLFTFSVVQSITLLQQLEIRDCEALAEVIVTPKLGDERKTAANNIQLPKLELLQLKNLPNLNSFCSENLIECDSLKVVQIESCPQLKTFVSDCLGGSTESSHEPGQTNSVLFDERVAFPKLEELHIDYMNELKMIWHDGSQANSLKVLTISHAKKILKIFESGHFQNLELLEVDDCDLLEEVFDDHFHLEPTQRDDDPSQIVSFDKLKSITVSYCLSLKSLFPVFMAKNLQQLEYLYIDNCGLEYIVSEEKITQTTPYFTFPRLKNFHLWELQDLKSFYSGIYALECPVLQTLITYHCDKFKIFFSNQEDMQETNVESREATQVQQPPFSFKEIVPNLVELGLNSTDATMIEQGQFPAVLFDKLKILHLLCFYDTRAGFPFHLLHKFQNVVSLVLKHCYFEGIVPNSTVGEDANALARIYDLRLELLPEMRHLWNQYCQPSQVLQNLLYLEVWDCNGLINLASSSTCFANLKTLDVWRCEGLINLVTTSMAKEMVSLTKMTVRECKSVTEIVADEGDERQSWCEVNFYNLTSLKLVGLSSLACFFPSASCNLKFPSLEEVIVTGCPNMKVFSQGVIRSPRLQKVHITEEMDKWRWTKDLNFTTQHLYTEMNPQTPTQE